MSELQPETQADYGAAVLIEDSVPYKIKPAGFFNRENASEMARRSNESQRLAKIAAKAAAVPADEPLAQSAYVAKRLSCVRAQLARIDEMILLEKDPQRLDRLASAQARLSEQERILDGRPLPGAFRPSKARSATAPSANVV